MFSPHQNLPTLLWLETNTKPFVFLSFQIPLVTMAGIIKPMCIVLIAAVLVVAVAPRVEAATRCRTGVSSMNPGYVDHKGPLGSCRSGVKGLYDAPDRQTVCSCLKSLASSCKGVDFSKVAGLNLCYE
ncbi:hypothetical protein Sango_2941500 [Sesamum angolense]|uniref:Uncharacterized protein n=1 Tax=Sesamum angolense TaxID=2727404 RepID=A0AAE1T530_9LAMI|nr:hypothetical protein Sango_2941500 [Sesamum angolense]